MTTNPPFSANPQSPSPNPDSSRALYAALYHPGSRAALLEIARDFSPRFEAHGDDLVVADVSGLERLLGPARVIGEEMRRTAAARGVRAHVAVAATQTAASLLARAQPGLTIVPPAGEAGALAPLALDLLTLEVLQTSDVALQTFQAWGLKTLGELAALPPADLVARMGRRALAWQAIARGDDVRPLVPMLEEERFESTLELEWPIEGLEPLSFVLTRLLEPLSTRLERRDRGAAVLHVLLGLITRETAARRLELPTPIRDVRALRTLALLDLESHPPDAAVDRVTIVIDPTPGRVLQHTLFTRAHPTPEQLATLIARLGALMGQDRIGAPATVDSYRPGAFVMKAFECTQRSQTEQRTQKGLAAAAPFASSASSASFAFVSALRRCRQPVPARVAIVDGRPVRVTTDRRGFAGGAVVRCAGPWRTSGNWWAGGAGGQPIQPLPPVLPSWDRDEWDVALNDGAVYRVFRDRENDRWFIDAVVD